MSRDSGSAKDLPDQTQPRILALVERSAPNEDRPHLSPDMEHRVAPVERKTAVCYAQTEEATFRLNRLAKRLDKSALKRGHAR